MTSTTIKKQLDKYYPLLSHKQQALLLEIVKSFLNIDKDEKQINPKQYCIDVEDAIVHNESEDYIAKDMVGKRPRK